MKYFILVLTLVASFTASGATTSVGTITPQTTETVFDIDIPSSAGISSMFADNYTFFVNDTFAFTSAVTGYDVDSFNLAITNTDTALTYTYDTLVAGVPNSLEADIREKTLVAGNYSLAVSGATTTAATSSAYIGSFTVGRPIASVPEPETYAMFLAGLGLLGFSARRRKQ